MKRRYSSIPVSKHVREKLLQYKLTEQYRRGRELTWDEIILELLRRGHKNEHESE